MTQPGLPGAQPRTFEIPVQAPQGGQLMAAPQAALAQPSRALAAPGPATITKIYNCKNETVIIHDLVNAVTKEPLRLDPPSAGLPHVVDVEDRYGAKAVRSSDGIRRALRDGLIAFVTPALEAQWDAMRQQYLLNPAAADANKSLNEKLEEVVGKIPKRRKRGEAVNDPSIGGVEDPSLIAAVNKVVKTPNVYDEQLKDLREELKHDIVQG